MSLSRFISRGRMCNIMNINTLKNHELVFVDNKLEEDRYYQHGNNKAIISYEPKWDGWCDKSQTTIGCFEINIANRLGCYKEIAAIVEKYLIENYKKAYPDDEWDKDLVHNILFSYVNVSEIEHDYMEEDYTIPFFERQYAKKRDGIPNSIIDLFFIDKCVFNVGTCLEQEEYQFTEGHIFVNENAEFAEDILNEIIVVLYKNMSLSS